jgi:hypothetical protein
MSRIVIVIFICALFNDALSSSECTVSNIYKVKLLLRFSTFRSMPLGIFRVEVKSGTMDVLGIWQELLEVDPPISWSPPTHNSPDIQPLPRARFDPAFPVFGRPETLHSAAHVTYDRRTTIIIIRSNSSK